jgi:hypothetical protein
MLLFLIICYNGNMHKALKPIIPLEESEQKALVQWLRLKGIRHTSVPNSTWTSSWAQKAKNKAMGLCPGLPDLVVCLPKTLLFIEMKRQGRKPTDDQKEWIGFLNGYEGVQACVCYGFDEARETIEEIMGRDGKLSQSEINCL